MTTFLFPVLLAGGSGTRLWPLSRHNYPKQFLQLNGDQSLLQHTMARVSQLNAAHTLIVSNDAHYFLCQEQLEPWRLQTHYLLEPCARNTAPAIACAAHHLMHIAGEDALMLVLPSDHWIADTNAWLIAMQQGADYARAHDVIATFGVTPDSPKTGYGYIEVGDELTSPVHQVLGFYEKPDVHTAKSYLKSGRFLWNSGMFVCRAKVYLDELARFEPEIHRLSLASLNKAHPHHDFLRLDLELFSQCASESIDYAVMEHTKQAVVIPVAMQWSDLGCWASVAGVNAQDEDGNAFMGSVITKDSKNCFIHSKDMLVTTIGIENQIIIATRDAVLVADKAHAEEVKALVSTLHQDHHHLTQDHIKVSRPWGYYEILAEGASFKVKRLMIKPGAKLSLQMHEHRAEHWVVVAGVAEVINHEHTIHLSVNQSTYIPPKTRHRLGNPGIEPLFVIEVQSGSYLGEDDIVRFDDIYSRTVPA
jgi:mannose-1-phosphate guanylyltransferase / mannose-6-phosphate isomerase